MHILFLTDNFPPEGNAPATRTYEHTREWVRKGHKVTVITCAPNFPEGKVYEGYRNNWLTKENIEDVEVWRVKTFITANEGFVKRILDYMSFMLCSFLFGLFSRRVDVVIGTSPQFFTIISAWALAKIKRVPFIFELRDIWPASIVAVGALRSATIIKFLEALEKYLYQQADAIVSVTQSFKDDLVRRGIDAKKISVVLNGVDLSKYHPSASKASPFTQFYNLEEKFVVGYVGTLGLAHSLENVVKAAAYVEDDDDIRIIFAGDGADRRRIEKLIHEMGLGNIIMIPRQPKEAMPDLWSTCDVSIISLKNISLFKTVIPSKIFESMAMGLPMISAVPIGEATQIIADTNTGLIVAPEDPVKLADAIRSLKDPRSRQMYCLAGQKAARQYSRENLALDMLRIVEQTVKSAE